MYSNILKNELPMGLLKMLKNVFSFNEKKEQKSTDL